MLVVVTGMHRSGTSAVAELLFAMGASLGPAKQLMGASEANPRGHFESLPIVAMNERILGEVGAHWLHPQVDEDVLGNLVQSGISHEARAALTEAGYDSGSSIPFVVKDPRFCLTLPFWRQLLGGTEDLVIVLAYRRPAEVVASLRARDGLDPSYGHYLWGAYNRAVLTAAQGLPMVAVSYETMIFDPRDVVARLQRLVPLDDPAAVTVDPSLRRQRASLTGELDGAGAALWRALESVAAGAEPTVPSGTADPDAAAVMGALRLLVSEWVDLRRERDAERAIHLRLEAAHRSEVDAERERFRRLAAEHAETVERLGDYESSRAAGLARASWALKRRARTLRKPGATEGSVLRPVESGEPVTLPVSDNPEFSIVMTLCGALPETAACLRSILAATGEERYEVLLAAGESVDAETAAWLDRCAGVQRIFGDDRPGTAQSIARSVEASAGTFVVLLDSDTLVPSGWLNAMRAVFDSAADIGAVGVKLVHPDGSVAEAGALVDADGEGKAYGSGGHPTDPRLEVRRDVDYCSTVCLAVRRDAWLQAGGLDSQLGPGRHRDADLAFALRWRRWRVAYQPRVRVVCFDVNRRHRTAGSEGTVPAAGNDSFRFAEKWGGELQRQPPPGTDPDVAAWRTLGPHVLVVDHEVPAADQDSGSLRMTTILELLTRLGCRVTFVPQNGLRRDPYVRDLQDRGIEVFHDWRGSRRPLDAVAPDVELMIVSRPAVASSMEGDLRRRFPRAPFVYDMVDFHALREERHGSAAVDPDETRAIERRLARSSDLVLAISDDEARMVAELEPRAAIEVLPNIHRPNRSARRFEERSGALFVGSWRHPPNRDAIEWISSEIAPLVAAADPAIRIHIVGSDMPADGPWARTPNVVCHGWVRSLDELASSVRVNVAPLRSGAGLKGKIGDALARGLPTVTTPIGAEGFGPVREALVVAEDAQGIADALVDLHRDRDAWMLRADLGAELIQRYFGVEHAEEVLRSILARLTGWTP